MADAGEPTAEPIGVPIADGSSPAPNPGRGEAELTAPSDPVRGTADGQPNAVPIAGVSRRFGLGHLLVAVGLFAVLFCFLRLLGAPPVAYVPCALFCVAIPLGQIFLYQGRQPRRASCLVGARLLPLVCLCVLTVVAYQDLVYELRYGRIDGRDVADFLTATLALVIVWTALGYLLGYLIGTISAGVFLVVDRRWDAGQRADGGSQGAGSGGASVAATSRTPPTGKWWLDWIAWSAALWFWQNRGRPVRNAIVLTILATLVYAIGIPLLWDSDFRQAYLIGGPVLSPLIGLTLSGLLVAGWRAPLVCYPFGIAAVAYPLYRFAGERWVWQSIFPDVPPFGMTLGTGIVLGLIAAGFSGWMRWTLTGRAESCGRRRPGLPMVAGFVALLVLLGLSMHYIADWERQQFVSLALASETATTQRGVWRIAPPVNGKQLVLVVCEEITEEQKRAIARLQLPDQRMFLVTEASAVKQGGTVARLQNLKQLQLVDCDLPKGWMEELKSLSQLEELDLAGSHLTDEDLQALGHLPSLKYLSLEGTNITDADLKHLAAVPSLQSLSLRRTKVAGPGLAHLKDLPRLAYLDLDHTPVDDNGLSHLPSLPALQHLYLSSTRVTDVGLFRLPPLPALQHLDLAGTRVTGDGLVHIKRLPALRWLDLSECDIQDEDLKVLYDFPLVWLHATGVSQKARRALEDAWRALEDGAGEPPDDEPDPPGDE